MKKINKKQKENVTGGTSGEAFTRPEDPKKPGQKFIGWYEDSEAAICPEDPKEPGYEFGDWFENSEVSERGFIPGFKPSGTITRAE